MSAGYYLVGRPNGRAISSLITVALLNQFQINRQHLAGGLVAKTTRYVSLLSSPTNDRQLNIFRAEQVFNEYCNAYCKRATRVTVTV